VQLAPHRLTPVWVPTGIVTRGGRAKDDEGLTPRARVILARRSLDAGPGSTPRSEATNTHPTALGAMSLVESDRRRQIVGAELLADQVADGGASLDTS